MQEITFTPLQVLDQMINAGWGNVQQIKIPPNWKTIPGPELQQGVTLDRQGYAKFKVEPQPSKYQKTGHRKWQERVEQKAEAMRRRMQKCKNQSR